MISIACLIYKSTKYLGFVYKSLYAHTPLLRTGEAEFYFVCNNATEEVKNYLKENNISHYLFETCPQPPYPHNISYIYGAWNFAVRQAKGEVVVLVNSDMAFSKDWLENLLKRLDKTKAVSSLSVESGRIPSLLPHTVVKNFGRTPETFQEEKFEQFAELLKEDTEQILGVFMPVAFHKENFIRVGGYPEGNRILSGGNVSGDMILFQERLASIGVKHVTSFDSVVYHIQEGEVNGK